MKQTGGERYIQVLCHYSVSLQKINNPAAEREFPTEILAELFESRLTLIYD